MAQKARMRAAKGGGSIRKRPDGTWEARFIYVDAMGATRRKSVYAKTQRACRQSLTAALNSVDTNTYQEPQRITVGDWLDLWVDTYCIDLKPRTISSYRGTINARIKPFIGAVPLQQLSNINVQSYINALKKKTGRSGKPLSPKTVSNAHGVLHKALSQAVVAKLIPSNPADGVRLPKKQKPRITPLLDDAVAEFVRAIRGDRYELVFLLALFSGLRQSEIMGLQWGDIDLLAGEITVQRQLQRNYGRSADDPYYLIVQSPKNGKNRNVVIPPSMTNLLRKWQAEQAAFQLAAGPLWDNPHGFVFTDELGHHIAQSTVRKHFKTAVESIGRPEVRFHDLRHSYATAALQSGDSIKAVQEQLGHYSSAFTMDTYADVSQKMRHESQSRMERFFKEVSGK